MLFSILKRHTAAAVVAVALAALVLASGCDSGNGGDDETFPPPAPVQLAAVTQDGSVVLTWQSGAGTPPAGYNVFRHEAPIDGRSASAKALRRKTSPEPAPINDGLVTEPRYVDSSVEPGTRYTYSVEAVNEAGEASSMSSSVDVGVFAQPPSRP
jgi:hypothetical protein